MLWPGAGTTYATSCWPVAVSTTSTADWLTAGWASVTVSISPSSIR
ncbi:Uncharacterised protein [Mycobacteroides abscessus subsp. abscessus]|nr:Uncharacterised protein [Mycobacteroides abscessus subsp. abscessus]